MEIFKRCIGQKCKDFRLANGYVAEDVAKDVGFTIFNIYKFEKGENDNYMILLWYIKHGLKIEDIMRCIYDR